LKLNEGSVWLWLTPSNTLRITPIINDSKILVLYNNRITKDDLMYKDNFFIREKWYAHD
jgi:hypothetical protein